MFSKLNLAAFCGVLLALFGDVALAGFRCGVVGEFLNVFSSSARHAACSASCTMFGQKTSHRPNLTKFGKAKHFSKCAEKSCSFSSPLTQLFDQS